MISWGNTGECILSHGWVNSHCKHRSRFTSHTDLPRTQKPNEEANSVLPELYGKLFKYAKKLKFKMNQNSGNKLSDEHIKQYQQRFRRTQEPFLWTRLIKTVTTMDVLSPIKNGAQDKLMLDNESKRSFNKRHLGRKIYKDSPNYVPDDVIQITTIIDKIRRRNKNNGQPIMSRPSSVAINKQITKRRFKRSATPRDSKKDSHSDDVTRTLITSTEKLYRHPKLTHEEQRNQKVAEEFVDIAKENTTNANEFTDFYKRIWDIINGTRPRFKIVVPSIKTPRRTQAAIFKAEHAASASEVEDLNLPYNMTGSSSNGDKKSLVEVPFDESRPSEEDELKKYAKVEVEGIEDDYPSDKYVSLNEGRKADDQTADSPEEIDSSVENLNLPYNQTGSSDAYEKLSPIRESFDEGAELKISEDNKPIDDVQTTYDVDKIPYVEVPDYEDEREESLDEVDRRQAKEINVGSLNSSRTSADSIGAPKAYSFITSLAEESETAELGNKNVAPYPITKNKKDDKKLENPDKVQDEFNDSKNSGNEEIQSKEQNESVLSAIHFDINEYKKPFNLDDFLKNEPFFAKFRKDKDYARESSDRDEVTEGNFPSALEDNVSVDFYDEGKQERRYEHASQDDSNRDYYMKPEAGSEEIINEDLYRYGDKDFFKRLFKENRKKRENFAMSAEEEDFLDRYFTKDVIKKLKEDSDEEELRETKKKERIKKQQNQKDVLKALSSILEKKDRISRLDEEVNKEIKDGKNTPSVYKNYWSLEYVLPGKNDQSSNGNKTDSL